MFPSFVRMSRARSAGPATITTGNSLLMYRSVCHPSTRVTSVRGLQSQQAVGVGGATNMLVAGSFFSHQHVGSHLHTSRAVGGGGAMMVVGGLACFLAASGAGTTETTTTTSAEIVGVGGTPVQEPATGILFPKMVNGFYFAGCGVRIKYVFVKVYAVASYFDPLAMSAVKTNPLLLQEALSNPTYPRTIKIIMNRNLSADKMTAALVEALEPRMAGHDLDKLEEFKKMNPPLELVKGAEIEMTIRGDTFLYKNAVGGLGTITSAAFCKAMCDTFYGLDPVSPPHKQSVLEGIAKM